MGRALGREPPEATLLTTEPSGPTVVVRRMPCGSVTVEVQLPSWKICTRSSVPLAQRVVSMRERSGPAVTSVGPRPARSAAAGSVAGSVSLS